MAGEKKKHLLSELLTVYSELDYARQTWPDAVARLAQVEAGVGSLTVVDDKRAVFENAHVQRRYYGPELARWLSEEICV